MNIQPGWDMFWNGWRETGFLLAYFVFASCQIAGWLLGDLVRFYWRKARKQKEEAA